MNEWRSERWKVPRKGSFKMERTNEGVAKRESANGGRSELYTPFVPSSFEHATEVSLACESAFDTEVGDDSGREAPTRFEEG